MNSNDDQFSVTSPWPQSSLDAQTVEFRLGEVHSHASGIGKFRVTSSSTGKQKIQIVVTTEPSLWKFVDTIHTLDQAATNRIRLNPDQAKAKFELFL